VLQVIPGAEAGLPAYEAAQQTVALGQLGGVEAAAAQAQSLVEVG
jgi:hypothetical protein